jgi:hypothetical protein
MTSISEEDIVGRDVWRNLKERYHLQDLNADIRITLKYTLN